MEGIKSTEKINGSRGRIEWKDGNVGGEIVFIPDPEGVWIISKHPKDFESNNFYCPGIDPISPEN